MQIPSRRSIVIPVACPELAPVSCTESAILPCDILVLLPLYAENGQRTYHGTCGTVPFAGTRLRVHPSRPSAVWSNCSHAHGNDAVVVTLLAMWNPRKYSSCTRTHRIPRQQPTFELHLLSTVTLKYGDGFLSHCAHYTEMDRAVWSPVQIDVIV